MSNNNSPKLVPRKYLFTFILVTSLFALWGFANDITNPMVAAFQTVMELSAAKASMVQFAFYGGYATMAIPAALFIRRYSYKKGILLGLALYATGAFLFIPAASYQEFTFFCLSLYILTFGLAFCELRLQCIEYHGCFSHTLQESVHPFSRIRTRHGINA